MRKEKLVFGKGMIAKASVNHFQSQFPLCIFASGVSNSSCTNIDDFLKEKNLLLNSMDMLSSEYKLIYFSTCSIYDPQLQCTSAYVAHKLEMEHIVSSFSNYSIIRLPQVVGNTVNPYTIVNFFKNRILNHEPIVVQRYARRNIIDVEDALGISTILIDSDASLNASFNVANTKDVSVLNLVDMIEDILKVKASVQIVNSGSAYMIDTAFMQNFGGCAVNVFSDDYVYKTIQKYCS